MLSVTVRIFEVAVSHPLQYMKFTSHYYTQAFTGTITGRLLTADTLAISAPPRPQTIYFPRK